MNKKNVGLAAILTFFLIGLATASRGFAQAGRGVGRLGGVVVDAQDRPIEGAKVVLIFVKGDVTIMEATTDKKGDFSFIGLGTGNFVIKVTAAGYAPEERKAYVSQLSVIPKVTVKLQKAGTSTEGGVVGGVMGGVVGDGVRNIQGGLIGGITEQVIDDILSRELRKIVTFEIEHLLVKATETISLTRRTMRTEEGLSLNYGYNIVSRTRDEVGLVITPKIVEGQGIELNISILHNKQPTKEEKVVSRNFEPVLVELLENKDDHSKLVDKITPFIEVIPPSQKYPKALDKLEMIGHVLIMNDMLLINNSKGGGLSSGGGSETEPAYLYFWVKGKGVYVLSFWPFEGAEPIGVVSDSVIRIRHGKDYFAWFSMKPILPEGKWRVWVRNNPDYDPLQARLDDFKNESPQDQERMKARLQKEHAAVAGIASGGKTLELFFGKK